jgi:hypothetical protein
MVWAAKNFLSARIRLGCPVLELWHPYKKLMEDVWRKPELFYTFWAPLEHSIHPTSAVYTKPKMKKLEAYFTAMRLLWPEFRELFLALPPPVSGQLRAHLRNIILIFEFFIPIVCSLLLLCSVFLCASLLPLLLL